MRTNKIRLKAIQYLLDNGPQPTNKILDHINDTTRHGSSSQQLGNVLSKNKAFVKVGNTMRQGVLSGYYEICVWGLAQD